MDNFNFVGLAGGEAAAGNKESLVEEGRASLTVTARRRGEKARVA